MQTKKESVTDCIKQETDKDLINIHNFITSIGMHDNKNMTVFELWAKLEDEIRYNRKTPLTKKYLQKMDALLGTQKYLYKTK